MFRKKKIKKEVIDQELLHTIYQLKNEWTNLEDIMARSIEPSERGQFDLAVAKAKYFYLIREAKYRRISAGR
ncbi:YaaL family protein [Gracilibacillus xinjiangensis]|uniref:YaaL family protein n=1 Tax=Gracilibacillus xinjiangensis TaxID=1193282 RepID=A0ABV8WR86_9BACI